MVGFAPKISGQSGALWGRSHVRNDSEICSNHPSDS